MRININPYTAEPCVPWSFCRIQFRNGIYVSGYIVHILARRNHFLSLRATCVVISPEHFFKWDGSFDEKPGVGKIKSQMQKKGLSRTWKLHILDHVNASATKYSGDKFSYVCTASTSLTFTNYIFNQPLKSIISKFWKFSFIEEK